MRLVTCALVVLVVLPACAGGGQLGNVGDGGAPPAEGGGAPTGAGGSGGFGAGGSGGEAGSATGGSGGAGAAGSGGAGAAGSGGAAAGGNGGAGGAGGAGKGGAGAAGGGGAGGAAGGAGGAAGGAGGASGGGGGAGACVADGDCPDPLQACQLAACIAGVCTAAFTPAGEPCPGGICDGKGDCLQCPPGSASCDGDAQNGCETTLASDAGHCGACGHSCGGGACAAGKCQPLSLGDENAHFYHLDETHAYLGTWAPFKVNNVITYERKLYRVEKAGGATTPMITMPSGPAPTAMTGDADHLYWADYPAFYWKKQSAVRRAKKSDESQILLYEYPDAIEIPDLVVDAGTLFWADRPGIGVQHVMAMAQGVSTLATTSGSYIRLAVDATHVYFSELAKEDPNGPDTYAIRRVPRAGGAVETIVPSYETFRDKHTTDFAIDDAYVYWMQEKKLRRALKATGAGAADVVASPGGTPSYAIATDAQHVYFGVKSGAGSDGNLSRAPKAGGAPEVVAGKCMDGARRIQLDGGFAYYTCNAVNPYLHKVVKD